MNDRIERIRNRLAATFRRANVNLSTNPICMPGMQVPLPAAGTINCAWFPTVLRG